MVKHQLILTMVGRICGLDADAVVSVEITSKFLNHELQGHGAIYELLAYTGEELNPS